MKHLFARASLCASLLAAGLAPTLSHAGGFDLTGQPVGIIFEEGSYIEGQVGLLFPTVKGTNPLFGDFGNTAVDQQWLTMGAKLEFNDRFSAALIYDTPFLRQTDYTQGLYLGTEALAMAETVTAIGRFKLNENFSIYGGPRLQAARVDLSAVDRNLSAAGAAVGFPDTGVPSYEVDVRDTDFGFVVGASAEIPKYKARLAVTYNSAITHDMDAVELFRFEASPGNFIQVPRNSSFDLETPQSINVDLQAPVTKSTLLRANIRWADWGGVNFSPPNFVAAQNRPVVEYTEDVLTYRLTAIQRLNNQFAAFITGSYEEDGGEEISLFKSVDGGTSLGGGLVYSSDKGLRITLAGEYRWLEGTDGVQIPNSGLPASDFNDTTAVGVSMKVGYRF